MAKKSAAPKLPKTVYVRWAGDEPDLFLDAADDAAKHAEIGDERAVGIYELVRVAKVTAPAKIE